MTTRELLRAAAKLLENAHDYHVEPMHAPTAIALRAIADRFDAEMEYAKPAGQTYGMLKFHKEGALACLARLDAPVTPE